MDTKMEEDRDETAIARLLRSAGRGPTASDDARARIYAAVRAEWQRNATPASERPRRRSVDSAAAGWMLWLTRALPVAAAIAAVALGLRLLETPSVSSGIDVASIAKTTGVVTRLADSDIAAATLAAPATVRAGDVIRTAANGGASLTLTSGVMLRVAADSELLLAADDRIELRRGTAYIDADPGLQDASALLLETPFGTVNHIGTQYETRVGANNLRIRIREGTVRFVAETESGNVIDASGTVGEQLLTIAGDDMLRRSTIALTGPDWAWVEALASAPAGDEHSLTTLLEWVARETGRELQFADGAVAANADSATIVGAAGLTPDETLDVIARSTGFDIEPTDTALVVR